jgi:hypothetical protein
MATSIPEPALMNLHKADKLISLMLKSVADDDEDDDELASEQAPCTLQMDLRKCVRCVLVHPHHHHCKSGGADFTFTLHNLHEQSSYGVMDDPSAHGHVCYYSSGWLLCLLQHWRMSNL